MKLAVICPPRDLVAVTSVGTSYQFLLGQYLDNPAYFAWYQEAARLGDFLIVDNGAAEFDNSMPFEEIVYRADLLNADEIVMPDKIGDPEMSYKMTTLPRYLNLVPPKKRMVVPQGNTIREWCKYLDALVGRIDFATIGIPKHLEDKRPAGRLSALHHVIGKGFHHKYNIHLLGIAGNPVTEVRKYAKIGVVRGMDSGAPIAWAQRRKRMTENSLGRYSLDWFARPDIGLAEKNIEKLLSVIYEEQQERIDAAESIVREL